MATETRRSRRKNRYSDEEISLIKNTFAENDELLFSLRKHFLQMPLDFADNEYLKVFRGNKPLMSVMRKAYTPQIEADAPLTQALDLYMLMPIKDMSPIQAEPEIMVWDLAIAYFTEQLDRLEDAEFETTIDFASLALPGNKDELDRFVEMKARNMIIVSNESQLNQFDTLAGLKDETLEQTKARLQQNSNK